MILCVDNEISRSHTQARPSLSESHLVSTSTFMTPNWRLSPWKHTQESFRIFFFPRENRLRPAESFLTCFLSAVCVIVGALKLLLMLTKRKKKNRFGWIDISSAFTSNITGVRFKGKIIKKKKPTHNHDQIQFRRHLFDSQIRVFIPPSQPNDIKQEFQTFLWKLLTETPDRPESKQA